MNQFRLTKNEIISRFGKETHLEAIIQLLEKDLEKRGEVVCRVSINDMKLSEDDEKKFAFVAASEIQELIIESENPDIIFKQLLEDWTKGIPDMIKLADKLAARLRFDGIEEALFDFTQLIDSCHLLVNSLDSIRGIFESKKRKLPEGWKHLEANLQKAFHSLMDSWQTKNDQDMANIIEFDIADNLQSWVGLLNEFKQELK